MAILEGLQARIAKLTAQAEAIVKKDSTAEIATIRELMEKHGLTTTDIDAHVRGGKKHGRRFCRGKSTMRTNGSLSRTAYAVSE